MTVDFKSKSGKVVVVESTASLRTMITDVVKSLGFADVQGVPSYKEALDVLEVEPVLWVLGTLMADQAINALHVVKTVNGFAELAATRVSLFADEADAFALPLLYANGILSHHPKITTKDALVKDLKDFLKEMESVRGDHTLLAASYLRRHLKAKGDWEALAAFESAMVEQYPNQPMMRMNVLEPLRHLDRKRELAVNVNLLRVLVPLDDKAHGDLKKKYAPDDAAAAAGADGARVNVLSLGEVVVVDPDATIRKSIEDILGDLGVERVSQFSDGETALDHLTKNPNPSLVIHEWRLPKAPGPVFVQRVKTQHAVATPLIVASSLIQAAEQPLVREMGVAKVVPKPFDKDVFLRAVIDAVQQDRVPTEHVALDRKVRVLLRQGQLAEARGYLDTYVKDPAAAAGNKKALEAEFLLASGEPAKARDLAIEAVKANGDSLALFTLLGKAMMALRDFESALKCFTRAQALSPANIERLCAIADTQMELGQDKDAKATLAQAMDLDPDSEKVAESQVKLAMSQGSVETAKSLMSGMGSLDNVISFLNNQAVALAKTGKMDEGIAQYRRTLEAIPDDRHDVRSLVAYNLGLAQAKAGHPDDAIASLKMCLELPEGRAHKKAASLLARLEAAKKGGIVLTFQSADGRGATAEEAAKPAPAAKSSETGGHDVTAAVLNRPKDRCCYMIFVPAQVAPEARKLEAGQPRFMLRSAIARAESHGVDKLAKAQ